MTMSSAKRIVEAIQKLYPLELANKTFDNTGLLVDVSPSAAQRQRPSVLLANDLTSEVCDEAIEHDVTLILAYHPFIFRGLKSITTRDPQQTSLLKLIHAGIGVYCPHTAIDAAVGGVNDFLAEILSKGAFKTISPLEKLSVQVQGHEQGGQGRLVVLKEPTPLEELIQRTKAALGLAHVQVAYAVGKPHNRAIETVAICAGSGGDLFRGVRADLFFTGELSHHEALFFKESGSSVIVCGHSNTERPYLPTMSAKLNELLPEVHILISEKDADPLAIV